MNVTILNKKPKILATSPVFTIASSDSFRMDLTTIIPIMEKGIVKEVKNILPVPSQKKERKISMLISPNIGLRIPLKSETPLDFTFYYPKVLMYSC